MIHKLIITKNAMQDELEAYHYYEDIRAGLGEKFLESLENRYANISEHPEYYSYSDSNNIIRDVAIDNFPYLIIYEVSGDNVIVYAVHCTYQKPIV